MREMRNMRSYCTLSLLCTILLGLMSSVVPIVESGKPAPYLSPEEQSLVNKFDTDYAMDLCRRLSSFPYPYLGEVVPGSKQDNETANYISNEMRALELSDVTVEEFPVVNWNYKFASLKIVSPTVDNPSVRTRSMANSPSTPEGGLEGELVHVGLGWALNYEKVAGGVAGKIVLINRSDVMWMTTPAVDEAAYHGAVAAIIYNPARDPAALNIDCAHNKIPTVSVTGNDAIYLMELLQKGPVKIKVIVDNEITEDAPAHAVYGFIWGSKYPDEYVVFEGHYDHWWSGAIDDNGGLASTLAIAKAVKDAGIIPKRTLVFMALSGHESGTGGSKESYWDWALGGYYFPNILHPEWAGKVVGSFISDGGGVRADFMMVETTPELNGFLKKVAYDVRVSELMIPNVFTPVSSFDSWGFYMAGMPASTCYYGALLAAFEAAYYHTDLGTMNLIHPEYLRMDAVFRGVAGLRLSQAEILPHQLSEISKEVQEALNKLLSEVPDANVLALIETLKKYEREAMELRSYIQRLKNPKPSTVKAINAKMLECIKTVNPLIWDQDIGVEYPLPGWCSVSKFDTYTQDMPLVKDAIDALKTNDAETALRKLEDITTMDWGEHVSYPVYKDIVWLFNGTQYLYWATDHLPWVTDVHGEYDAIKWKLSQGNPNFSPEIAALSAKLATLYEKLGITTIDVKAAFDEGTAILETIV